MGQVGDTGTEAAAITDRRHHLGLRVADDDADLGYPGTDERLEPVEHDRLVGDRDELLGARVRDRPQPGARSAGEDERLHRARRTVSGAGVATFVVIITIGGRRVTALTGTTVPF